MSIFPIFKTKPFFTDSEKELIVDAIRNAELKTSGEVRVYIESKNPLVSQLERAKEVFYDLKMDKTKDRNAVLIYLAVKHKEVAIFADEGIYSLCGTKFWNDEVKKMISDFEKTNIVKGIKECVTDIGNTLKEKFPYNEVHDKNELPDEIVFGK
jgi:uncharacterized membrane protein